MAMNPIRITEVELNFRREPLHRPFGFKGSAMTEVWQPVVRLSSDRGDTRIGLGTQNVLWSDARVFAAHTEQGGNALMVAMTEYGLQLLKGRSFTDPVSLLDEIWPEVYAYGQRITGREDLRQTFALNALVPLDNAVWLLYADANGFKSFDQMLPAAYRPGLSQRLSKVAALPALGYGTPMEEIRKLAEAGFFIMKIKIGAPGSQADMLEKDKAFMRDIHQTLQNFETPHTTDGKLPYYFDANGRYDSHDTLRRFLDYADEIGALDQIAVVEEPFGERNQESVQSLLNYGPRLAADESAHTDADARRRIGQGYNAIAVKAIAKTLSMTLKIVDVAHHAQVPCFCADLTVNPVLVEWNKCVAARLGPFPGLDFGLQETNGWQNYAQWEQMMDRHPAKDAPWVQAVDGVYQTGAEFFEESGGIFKPLPQEAALMGSGK